MFIRSNLNLEFVVISLIQDYCLHSLHTSLHKLHTGTQCACASCVCVGVCMLPWWLAGPQSQERVVDSAPPEHQPPAGSETGLGGRSQG